MSESSEINQLRRRVRSLEGWVRFAVIACALAVGVGILLAALPARQSADQSIPQFDTVRARHFSVVDEKGVERVHIGYPVPEPMIGGKRGHRREKEAGIILSNADGNEVGGWGIFDDRSQSLCFDFEGRERLCLVVWQNGKGEVLLNDERARPHFNATTLSLNKNGLRLFDLSRKERARLRLEDDGSPKLELLDDKGQMIFAAPEQRKSAENK